MKTIYKYPLHVNFCTIDLPKDSKVVCVHEQNLVPTLWIELETSNEMAFETFFICGTGQQLPEDGKHVGTCFIGPNVWHVYQK
jgi:hypothetical protein